MVVDKPRLITWNQLAAGARSDPPWAVGDEYVEDLGTANSVQDLDAEALVEPLVERFGQSLAG